MKRCTRCRSSMLLDYSDVQEGTQQVWKCLGCGREMLLDVEAQATDDLLLDRIRIETGTSRLPA